MLKWLFRLLLVLLLVLLVGLALGLVFGPLLIDPRPRAGAERAETVATPDSRFINIPFNGTDGLRVHYLAAGPGPRAAGAGQRAFVLLHGFTFNAFTWDRLLPVFAEFGPVVAYDQPPYGLSAKPLPGDWQGENPYSKAAAVAQLLALLDAFGIERVVLVGNSSGGTLALEAAELLQRQAPQQASAVRIEGLILLGPWVHSKRPILPGWLAGLPQMQRISLLIARHLGTDSPLLDYSYADPTLIDAARREVTGIHQRMAGWDLAWGALLQHSLVDPVDISQRLDQVSQPVLVITGAADQVVPVADTEATAAALPNASLVLLPACGHLPQEECPGPVGEAVRAWLAALPPMSDPAPAPPVAPAP